MKKTILLLLMCSFAIHLMAQVPTIKNSSFENWTDIGGKLYPDMMNRTDTAAVQSGALTRKSGGSVGSYSLHLGSYTKQGSNCGSYVEIKDILSSPVGGMTFDCIIQNNKYLMYNGLALEISFYDSLNKYVGKELWSSPSLTNYNSFTSQTWNFNSPLKAYYYDLRIEYFNYKGVLTEYSEIDNLRFLKVSTSVPEHKQFTYFYYPNPASNTITIVNQDGETNTIKILNLNGENVLYQELHSHINNIDISSLKGGVYLIQLSGKSGIMQQKLTKM